LPEGLTILNCGHNNLRELPVLPKTIQDIRCPVNPEIRRLPELPDCVRIVECSHCQIAELPTLPMSINVLTCVSNGLTRLPELKHASNLHALFCCHNNITVLPELPQSLYTLSCNSNRLEFLPELPIKLEVITCKDNHLKTLPYIPAYLGYLRCQGNPIEFLWVEDARYDYNYGVNQNIIIWERFRRTCAILRLKRHLREYIWKTVLAPKIEAKYHPNNLVALIGGALTPENENELFDESILDKW